MHSPEEQVASFAGVDRVVADPLRLKLRLGIGEDAFASLHVGRSVQEVAGYGVMRLYRTCSQSRVQVVPTFINTPIDLLGASLFDLIGALALKVAKEGGGVDDTERHALRAYFVEEWGLDPLYVERALPVIEENSAGQSLDDLAHAVAIYQRDNPDCNHDAMHRDLLLFLREIAEADGHLHDLETAAIDRIDALFRDAGQSTAARAVKQVASAPARAAGWVGGLFKNNRPIGAQPAAAEEGPGFLQRMIGRVWTDNPDEVVKNATAPIPVLWLLGKTGAGKSTVVRLLTGLSAAEVGNGFSPCTRTSTAFDHPADMPVLRFLDTRGLSEVGYDPTEDLAVCESASHAILAVARLDDPVQGELAEAIGKIRKRRPSIPVLVLHTGADLVPDPDQRCRARARTQTMLEAGGKSLPSVELSLPEPDVLSGSAPAEPLIEALSTLLPEAALFLMQEDLHDDEARAYAKNKSLIFWYAGAAGASDAAPLIGLVTVPGLQGAMLHQLARRYGLEWTKTRAATFAGALGSSILLRYGAELGLRQMVKLIPVYGQTVGAASAATLSFATTVALGRAAAAWIYHESRGNTMDADALRAHYAAALGRAVRGHQ
ncbi:MAG: TerB family tellurite resistance protein [Paracoccaceae bacterium]